MLTANLNTLNTMGYSDIPNCDSMGLINFLVSRLTTHKFKGNLRIILNYGDSPNLEVSGRQGDRGGVKSLSLTRRSVEIEEGSSFWRDDGQEQGLGPQLKA